MFDPANLLITANIIGEEGTCMHLKLSTLILTTFFSCAISAGTIYTWTDSDGIKHYSDKPPQGEERLVVQGDIRAGELKIDRFTSMKTYTPPTTGNSVRRQESKPITTSGEMIAPPTRQ
ncbi:DUF4124 domain-containing protein [Neptuniibacter caesariensis]|uniref:DUF4124 domain-containing protein n=1 Tax=Neptuniibacter caesariensis TaxID=207954 RepID=UPI00138A675D|nr:DUF4124 domain-containing protein [Neptuniibacter caesariensis]